ncbi:MAG: GTP-binding protein [Opitutales bacterium]|nr:GTP-binding protein [Opitutales bacterium]
MSDVNFLHWKPQATHLSRKLPVTVLSGFLGAGKTTLLNNLLREPCGKKIAVIVNDLGEVNIDASLIREGAKEVEDEALDGMMELTEGCICCSIRTDLADALVAILENYSPDHLIIEATGAAEPLSIAETLYATNAEGFSLQDVSFINNLVTVIDAGFMATEWQAIPKGKTIRRRRVLQSDPRRPLIELLIEQAECADLIVLNKTDLLETDEVSRLRQMLVDLNPHAEIETTREAKVAPETILERTRFEEEKTVGGARWRQILTKHMEKGSPDTPEEASSDGKDHSACDHAHGHCEHEHHHHDHEGHRHDHEHDHGHEHHHQSFGLESFLFTARRPFREKALMKTIRSSFPGLVRAKGFYWTKENPDRVGMLSLAGNVLRADYVGTWWKSMIEEGEAREEEMPPVVRKVWDEKTGDCRQELVFIGIDLPEAEIREKLEKALVG